MKIIVFDCEINCSKHLHADKGKIFIKNKTKFLYLNTNKNLRNIALARPKTFLIKRNRSFFIQDK